MTRRLLTKKTLADKLGCQPATFDRNRSALESLGFPPPTLNADILGPEKWDEKAIDLWLDSRMPAHLRKTPNTAKINGNIADKLHSRARALAFQGGPA